MFKSVIKEQLKVPAHVDYLAELRDFVTRIGRKHGVSEKNINAFKLAIDEAGTNIIRHAYREYDEPGFILLRVIVRKASVTISLIDQGKFFDPRGVKNPDLQRYVDIGKKGGLGIFIIRKLMDEIDYRKTEEGNELRMTKYHDAGKRPHVRALPEKVRSIPLSLKAKYFIRTALALTLIVAAAYSYYYYKIDQTVRRSHLQNLAVIGNQIANDLTADKMTLEEDHLLYTALVHAFEKHKKTVYEAMVVDRERNIRVATDDRKWLSKMPPLPEGTIEVAQQVFQYTIEEPDANDKLKTIAIYDCVLPLQLEESNRDFGNLHVRLLKSFVDKQVLQRRWEYGRLALSILLMSYAGALLLIYILLNPFRKLADWVRALDHGEVQDEMDIDSSTEIGEIAQAFSEITTKFRESQKNLAEQEQLQKEMQVAQEIQQTLLPTDFPEIEGYEIASHYEAAKEVGGDYFDFVEVDKDTLGIVVADVSGKGVPGSLVMTMIRTALRTEARGEKDAAEVLSRVNDFVVGDMKKGMFVTIFYVIIDSKRRRLNYASAGHNPMILYRPSTQKTYYLNPKGFPIGIQLAEENLFRKSIESDTIQLAEDDILLLYTDGITEAMNGRRQLFGEERLLKVVRQYGHLRVRPFVEQLQSEIDSFTEGNVQYDDITLVAIKEKSSPEKEELRRAILAHEIIANGRSIREACEEAGITTYAYYNKYKRQFEEDGVENFEIDEEISVEAKHISIEDKTKIFDIIRNHPEFGAKRISEELNTEKYGYTVIFENKVYDELVRSRLNTRQLREAFVARGGRSKRRLKPPGTPLLTLDGRIILDKKPQDELQEGPADARTSAPREQQPPTEEKAPEVEEDASLTESTATDVDVDIETLNTPIEDLLQKGRQPETAESAQPESDAPAADASGSLESELPEEHETETVDGLGIADKPLSLEELFAGGSILEDTESSKSEQPPAAESEKEGERYVSPAANIGQEDLRRKDDERIDLSKINIENVAHEDEEVSFSAIEDLIKKEILGDSGGFSSNIVTEEDGTGVFEPRDSESENNTELDGEIDSVTMPEARAGQLQQEREELSEKEEKRENQAGMKVEKEKTAAPIQGSEEDASIVDREAGDVAAGPVAANQAERPDLEDQPEAPTAAVPEEQPDESPADVEGTTGHVVPPAESSDDTSIFVEALRDNGKHQHASEKKPQSIPSRQPQQKRELSATHAFRAGETAYSEAEDREKLLIWGLRHYKSQQFDQAIDKFKEAIAKYPNFKEAHSILGNAYFRKRMFREAFHAYRRVLELDERDTTALENIGVIFANQGEFERAVRQWKKILQLDPTRRDIERKIQKALEILDKKAVSA